MTHPGVPCYEEQQSEDLNEQRKPCIITQNGAARVVLQDAASGEGSQEALALLKILAIGNQQIEQGKVRAHPPML